jgi:hypothetical protein
MQLFEIVFERHPMVWFLLGLLFNAAGLYLGFDYKVIFVYLIGGWACCIYGLAIMFFRHVERPRQPARTRLSPNFISAGDTGSMPVSSANDDYQAERKEPATGEVSAE